MSTEAALIAGITRDCHDRLAVKVYADWLQEYRGLSRFGALREATRHRLPLLRQYEEASVTEMLKPYHPMYNVCCGIIRRNMPEAFFIDASFLVVRRFFPRSERLSGFPAMHTRDDHPVIWVTARWLLNRLNASALVKDADGNVQFLDDWEADQDFINNAW